MGREPLARLLTAVVAAVVFGASAYAAIRPVRGRWGGRPRRSGAGEPSQGLELPNFREPDTGEVPRIHLLETVRKGLREVCEVTLRAAERYFSAHLRHCLPAKYSVGALLATLFGQFLEGEFSEVHIRQTA